MTIDRLLLERLRASGIPDGRIRHLHDAALGGSDALSMIALHVMSDAVDGRVHTTSGPEIRADLMLTPGVHWTGAALRLAAERPLPDTVVSVLPGRHLSALLDQPAIGDLAIEYVETDAKGVTWVWTDAAQVQPPGRADWVRRMAYRSRLIVEQVRRRRVEFTFGSIMVNFAIAFHLGVIAPLALEYFLPETMFLGARLSLILMVLATLTIAVPRLEPLLDVDDARRKHIERRKLIQGWCL